MLLSCWINGDTLNNDEIVELYTNLREINYFCIQSHMLPLSYYYEIQLKSLRQAIKSRNLKVD